MLNGVEAAEEKISSATIPEKYGMEFPPGIEGPNASSSLARNEGVDVSVFRIVSFLVLD